jgi:hypothetical protein
MQILRGASMSRFALVVAFLLLATRPAVGQDTTYVPTSEYPNGRQVVTLYFGAKWCKPCGEPEVKSAIRRMKLLVAAQAKDSNAVGSAIVVAFDRNLSDALTFIEGNGNFDEYVIGNDITSLAAERFLWGDSLAQKAVPQVIVIERTVTTDRKLGITFGPHRVLKRIGGNDIVPWVQSGAPIWDAGTSK